MFIQKTRTNQLKVGMRCKYVGTSRPYGTLGVITRINKDSTIAINWMLCADVVKEQVYAAKPEYSYVWGAVLFEAESNQQETNEMQTVTLLTISDQLTLEITEAQAKLIRESTEGNLLTSTGTLVITKAIKQDGQYFALNPLKVTLPKQLVEPPVGFCLSN